MFVNEFESSSTYRLQQIASTLKSVHGVELDLASQSDDDLRTLGESCEIIKNSIVKESAFNTWMQNPEYTKNMLILEAIKIYLTEIAPKRLPRKRLKEGLEEASTEGMIDQAELGRAMMDYAQHAEHKGDEKELRILNAISQVGDKLTQLGSPFGPKTLTDMDKKVIYFAKKRMGWNAAIEEDPAPTPAKPGSVTMTKDGMTTTVPPEKAAVELPKLSAQGYKASEVKESDELEALMKQYGVTEDAGMDEGNEFSGALAAAKAAGKDSFEVSGKTYDVKEASAMMEAAKGPNLNALKEKKAKLEDKMDKIVKGGGKVLKNDPLHKQYDKVLADIKAAKKTVNEAMHMEPHDDYQASMARSELYRNTKYAMDMLKMVNPEDDIKPWVAANLSKAAQALDKIYHYMDYYMTFEPQKLHNVEEDATGAVDDGSVGAVARRNLIMIMEYSTKLFRMIQPGDKLEGWVAMKLTNASEAISSSKHYMDYAQFEKHMGVEMDAVVDQPMDLPIEEPVEEAKSKKKKKIKEGRMVTIGNLLMRTMLSEEQDLAQAETLLAAKAMSDELQGIAEKLAKMGVEDLMPIVDTMKEQFGQEMATAFNDTVKAAIDATLNSVSEAKDTTDNAILSLQQGQAPGAVPTDIEGAGEEPAAGGEEDEFAATPAAAGPEEEPLGRAKKPEGEEAGLEELEEAKRAKEPGAVATAQVMKMGGRFVTKDGDHLTKAGIKKRDEIIKAIEKEQKLEEAKRAKTINEAYVRNTNDAVTTLANLRQISKRIETGNNYQGNLANEYVNDVWDVYTWLKANADINDPKLKVILKPVFDLRATAKSMETTGGSGANSEFANQIINTLWPLIEWIKNNVDLTEAAKPDFLDVDKDGDRKEPMKKALKDKAKKDVKESTVEEKAPPGKKAEDFIKKNKASFKKRYGDKGEEVLYATAWKKFGKKEESAIKTAKMLESAKANKARLEKAFEAHKRQFKKMVSEGIATDPLKAGYGLEGETLLDQISDVDGMIGKLKEMLRAEMQQGVSKMLADAKQAEKAEVLESKKAQAPYGVMWKAGKGKKSKFFETADLRSYWIDLNKINLVEAKLINPEDFDSKINKLSRKG